MVIVTVVATSVTIATLYKASLKENRERLVETAQSQARLIEAVARFDIINSSDYPGGSGPATISQVIDSHKNFKGFGKTGEFTMARRDGAKMVFILSHRHLDLEKPKPVPFSSTLAEPMRMALSGISGSLIGMDYRGVLVMAAHEPVAILDLGIVAKIDLAEIRAPFIRASIIAACVGLFLIIIGSILFLRISDPIVRRIKKYSRGLEKRTDELNSLNDRLKAENLERKQAEEELGKSEAQLRTLVENIPGISYRCALDAHWTMIFLSRGVKAITGFPASDFINNHKRSFASIIYKDDSNMVSEVVMTGVRLKKTYAIEYRIVHADGDLRWIYDKGQAIFSGSDEPLYLDGVVLDITDLKQSEAEKEIVITDLKRALHEVKTLKGLIPICATCKKIRDDRGFWSKVETYISKHSDAEFSHSICNECAEKLKEEARKL